MAKFIRLDKKGDWKGLEHRSSFLGSALTESEEDIMWENGISCYELSDLLDTVESLYKYWTEFASCTDDDFKKMQVTVFEGEHNGCFGTEGEDLATCKKTVSETEAYDFMNAIYELKEALDNYINDWDEEEPKITEEEYKESIIKLLASIEAI